MNLVFISLECFPFAKASGLADLTCKLARDIEKLGHNIKLIMPRYGCIDPAFFQIERVPLEYKINFNGSNHSVIVYKGILPDSFVSVYFIESQNYFANPKEMYLEEEENLERERFFSQCAIHLISKLKFEVDAIHLFNAGSSHVASLINGNIPIVFTIHNLIGLYNKSLNTTNDAIRLSGFITATSEAFADELKQDEHRFTKIGLSEALIKKKDIFIGILSGIDEEFYNPENDDIIAQTYSKNYFSAGKRKCKEKLLDEIGLERNLQLPLFCLVSRLIQEKGIELLLNYLPMTNHHSLQLVILGKGPYEQELLKIGTKYKNIKIITEYNHNLSKKIYAGSDFILCLAKCEASGTSVLQGMKYGCVPVAYFSGAIKEILTNVDSSGGGNGIVFSEYDEESLSQGINKAIKCYRDKEKWPAIVKAAMSFNFDSLNTAKKYVECYEKVLNIVGVDFKPAPT